MNVHEHERFEMFAINALVKVGHTQASATASVSSWVTPKNVALRTIEPSAVVPYVKPPTVLKAHDVNAMVRLALTGKMGPAAKKTAQRMMAEKRKFIIAGIKARVEAKKKL